MGLRRTTDREKAGITVSKRARSRLGAAGAIGLFCLVLIALLVTAVLIQVRHERSDVIEHAIKANSNLAIAYEEHTIRTLKGIDAAAHFLAREYRRIGREIDLHGYITDGTIDASLLTAAVIADENGRIVAVSSGNALQSVADREFFKLHAAGDTGTLHISSPVIGRVTGRWTIVISRRINTPDGSFAGVVAFGLDPGYFASFYHELDLGPGGLAMLVGTDGITRARRSGDKLSFGQDLSGSTLLKEHRERGIGSLVTAGNLEGIRGFTSYRTVQGYPLVVAVGVSENDVLAGFRERRKQYFWAAALITAVIAGFAALLMIALTWHRRDLALLVRTDARTKATFDHAGIGIANVAVDGRLLQVNRKFAAMLGRGVAELEGRFFYEITHADASCTGGEQWEALIRNSAQAASLQIEERFARKDGSPLWALVTLAAVVDDAASAGYFLATCQDVSARKVLEAQVTQRNMELTETTVALKNVLESSIQYSIVSMDLNQTILTWNEGAYRNYGYTAEEMVNRAHNSVLHVREDIENGRARALFAAAFRSGSAEGVFERKRKAGDSFTASVSVTLSRDSAGIPIGYLMISKDITEQRRLEQQLTQKNRELHEQHRRGQEANRLKSEFLANMSHELRTPLNAIIGFSEIMHDGKVGAMSEQHKEFLGDVLTSARHLLQLINDILDLAKVEAGKMDFLPEPVHLGKVVGEVRDVLRTMAARTRIEVLIEIEPGIADVVADASKLKQVLYNYLSNALKFTPVGGTVTIRAKREDAEHYRLEVQDTGIGIRPESIGDLFAEFRQLDSSMAKQYQGTGLGLALTKRIVEAQGGRVGVTSDFGAGSTFYAILPAVMHGTERPREPLRRATAHVGSGGSVLVIEDDSDESAWLRRVLEENGHTVIVARDAFEGISLAGASRFDAILLDILLPGIDGWEALRSIRRGTLNRYTPVIVLSVTRESEIGRGYSIHDFLVKPVEETTLLRTIHDARRGGSRYDEILVLDSDADALQSAERCLKAYGYHPLCTTNPVEAIDLARRKVPAAAVLDISMPELDGVEFLRRFRRVDGCSGVPAIVWTEKACQAEELGDSPSVPQSIVRKSGEDAAHALVAAIREQLGRGSSRKASAAAAAL